MHYGKVLAIAPSTSEMISTAKRWGIEVDFSLPAQRVVRVLDRIAATRGYPLKLRSDNGPEFIAVALADWAEQHGVTLEFIKPASRCRMVSLKDSIAATAKQYSTCLSFKA